MEGSSTDHSEHHPARPDTSADVLVVEDERVARRALTYLLACSGFNPMPYESAEEALRNVDPRSDKPMVALIDVDLPGMSGLDLAERLEKLRPGIISIIITAASEERVERFLDEHSAKYFRKPIDFRRLLEFLTRAQADN